MGSGGDGEDARDAISTDGSRVFWTSEETGLYMRDVPLGVTIPIGANGEGGFQFASADGKRVFWTQNSSLFECEIPATALLHTDAARRSPDGHGDRREPDGSYVYWAAADHDLFVDHLQGGVWHLRQIATLSSDDSPDWAGQLESLAESHGAASPRTVCGSRSCPTGP